MTYAIVSTEGQMSHFDVLRECPQGWLPVLVFRKRGEARSVIPTFVDSAVAHRFRQRNLPKGWVCGVVELSREEIAELARRGVREWPCTYPHKVRDYSEFCVEILEPAATVEVSVLPTGVAGPNVPEATGTSEKETS